jgi:hypothetical protein
MAIEELKSIFRPLTIRRERDQDDARKGKKRPAPPKERTEETDPEKGKVDIEV